VILLEMLLRGRNLSLPDAMMGLRLVCEIGDELQDEVKEHFPELGQVREYAQFCEAIGGLSTFLRTARPSAADLANAIGTFGTVAGSLGEVSEVKIEKAPPPEVVKAAAAAAAAAVEEDEPEAAPEPKVAPGAVELSWEGLKEASELPQKVFMDGQNFSLIDEIDMGDKKSQSDHDFEFGGTKAPPSRTSLAAKYPDGRQVKAGGVMHQGGFSQWKIKGLKPGRDLIIAKRIDFARGDIVTAIEVEGQNVGEWEIMGSDRTNRWRNWLFKVPGQLVVKGEVTCKQIAVRAERDINMYGLWFYQADE
jgi:hypothetical protein